jgi:hypothetical protein
MNEESQKGRSVPINEPVRRFDVDDHPSRTPMRIVENGKTLTFRMDVLGEGTMEMVVEGNPQTGRLTYRGMRLVGAK